MNIKDALAKPSPPPMQAHQIERLDYLTLQQQYRLVEMIYQSSPDTKSAEITALAMKVLNNALQPPMIAAIGTGK